MKKLAIIGSGDLGKLIAWHAIQSGYEIAGYFDDYQEIGKLMECGNPILGKTSDVETLFSKGVFDELMIGIGYNYMNSRQKFFETFHSFIPFAKVIHPSCIIEKSVSIGDGAFVLPGVVLDNNVQIGMNVLLNTGCIIAHDSRVDNHSFLSPGVKIAGFVHVKEKCIIGIGSVIIDKVTVASGIRTGGGSVVINSIVDRGLYVGVPAKLVRLF